MVKVITAFVVLALFSFNGQAFAEWTVTQLTAPDSVKNSAALHPALSCTSHSCYRNKTKPFYPRQKSAPNGLPDGEIAASLRYRDIGQAWYILPTRRYRHAILGDAVEAGGLAIKTRAGNVIRVKLPFDQVFEDRTPRLADLDGDGAAEVITIQSSVTKGAAIAVFGLRSGKLERRARTPFIGRSHRWLNIAGIADFNGDGRLDIAAVWTPHIGGTLKFWTLSNGNLRLLGVLDGFSNHFIGSREQRLSAVGDIDGNGVADMVLPSANRRSLRMVGFIKAKPAILHQIELSQPIDKAIYLEGRGSNTIITLGLADHSTVAVHQ